MPEAETWPDLKIQVAPAFPRVEPGRYQARSVDLKAFSAFRRRNLRIDFDVYHGNATDGVVLARVPLFIPLPAHRLSSASKLARLFALLGVRPRQDHLTLDLLRHRLWLVEVGDAKKDSEGHSLSQRLKYSVVKVVLEHLA